MANPKLKTIITGLIITDLSHSILFDNSVDEPVWIPKEFVHGLKTYADSGRTRVIVDLEFAKSKGLV